MTLPNATQFFTLENPFITETGSVIPMMRVAYRTWGTLEPNGANVVWICHAFSGNADADSWWADLVGTGRVFDPSVHFIVCANIPGSCYGSTGPRDIDHATGAPYGVSFPLFTSRDVARTFDALRLHLGIPLIRVLIGGSMGGQHVLEWSLLAPDSIERIVPIATNARHSPWGIAYNATQRMALEADSTFTSDADDAGKNGLAAARAIAMLSYRTPLIYQASQLDADERVDAFRAEGYQRYQGEKLVKRFHAHAYWTLSKTMDAHDVGRERGGTEAALRAIAAQAIVIGVDSDLLFPTREQRYLADLIPNARYREMTSTMGHDAFIGDQSQLSEILLNERITDFS